MSLEGIRLLWRELLSARGAVGFAGLAQSRPGTQAFMPQRGQPAALSSSSRSDPAENLGNTQMLFVNRFHFFS